MMLSKRQKMITALIAGVVAGGGLYFLYLLRAHTYLTDEPSACVNCHIMSPYYATWMHSSHSRNATCNDCHVPHENFFEEVDVQRDGRREARGCFSNQFGASGHSGTSGQFTGHHEQLYPLS